MIDWLKRIKENENEIKRKLKKAIRMTYDFTLPNYNPLLNIYVLLSKNGKAYLKLINDDKDNGKLKEVENGEAIEIAFFCPLESDVLDDLWGLPQETIEEIFKTCDCEDFLEDVLKLKEENNEYKFMVFMSDLPEKRLHCITKKMVDFIVEEYFKTDYPEIMDNILL